MPTLTAEDIAKFPLFKNAGSDDTLGDPETIDIDSFKNDKRTKAYVYVITADNQFILGSKFRSLIRENFPTDFNAQHHQHFARGKEVLAAGEIRKENGKWYADNASGHYRVHGPHQKDLLEWKIY